jgi:hypothetical protein
MWNCIESGKRYQWQYIDKRTPWHPADVIDSANLSQQSQLWTPGEVQWDTTDWPNWPKFCLCPRSHPGWLKGQIRPTCPRSHPQMINSKWYSSVYEVWFIFTRPSLLCHQLPKLCSCSFCLFIITLYTSNYHVILLCTNIWSSFDPFDIILSEIKDLFLKIMHFLWADTQLIRMNKSQSVKNQCQFFGHLADWADLTYVTYLQLISANFSHTLTYSSL